MAKAKEDYEYLIEIPESQLLQLVVQVKSGDKKAMGHVITAHIRMVERVCGRYIYIYPHKKDDIISSAMLGLTQAVVWSSQGRLYDLNITPYIVETVKRFIKDFLEHDHLINIPRKTFHKMMDESPCFVPVVLQSGSTHSDDEEDHTEDYILTCAKHTLPEKPIGELLDALRLSDFERQVVTLKADGYTFQEIADRFEKSQVWIIKTMQKISEKVKQ